MGDAGGPLRGDNPTIAQPATRVIVDWERRSGTPPKGFRRNSTFVEIRGRHGGGVSNVTLPPACCRKFGIGPH